MYNVIIAYYNSTEYSLNDNTCISFRRKTQTKNINNMECKLIQTNNKGHKLEYDIESLEDFYNSLFQLKNDKSNEHFWFEFREDEKIIHKLRFK